MNIKTDLFQAYQGPALKYGCFKATRSSLACPFDNITPFLESDI